MKKMMMFAAMAMMAVTAQAVTINWGDKLTATGITIEGGTTVNTRYEFPTAIATSASNETVTKGAIKVVTTFSASESISGWPGYLFMFGETWTTASANMKGFGYYFGQHSTGLVNEHFNIGSNVAWSDLQNPTLVNGEKYEFIIAMERNGGELGVDIYMNDTKIATLTANTECYWYQSISGGSKLNGTDVVADIGKVSLFGTEVYFAGDVSRADVAATLPEPTALALLALGVAGVALKRKMK